VSHHGIVIAGLDPIGANIAWQLRSSGVFFVVAAR
jgi:hypothetical protein